MLEIAKSSTIAGINRGWKVVALPKVSFRGPSVIPRKYHVMRTKY